jgi:isopenicillin-N epimerase
MPLQFSHVYDKKVDEKSKWSASFFWPGTDDFTAYLSIPFAIDFMGKLMGSWSALQTHNRELCLSARQLIAARLETALPAPTTMIGNLSNILISPVNQPYEGPYFNYIHPIQEKLFQEYKIEVPIFALPFSTRANWLRIAVQAYNSIEQYEYLADALYEIRATTT